MKINMAKSGKDNEVVEDELNLAFGKFKQSSQKLADLYGHLRKRVELVDKEMEEKNKELRDKVDELNRTTQYVNSILESMHSGVVAIDLDGKVTTINKAGLEILGIERDKVLKRSCEEVMASANGSGSLLNIAVNNKLNLISRKREVVGPDNKKIWVESSVSLLKKNDGSVIGAIEVFKDLSEIKMLENRLEEADNLASIGEMTASIAHEIRNPLNGIKGFASLLDGGFNHKDPRKRFVNHIVKGVDNLNNMVTDLLMLAKPIKPDVKVHDVMEIMDEVISIAREDLRVSGNSIDISTDYEMRSAFLNCDRIMLYQVFFNLLKNSFQAISDSGSVLVKIHSRFNDNAMSCGSDIEISIADNGVGINEESLARIFEPFYTTKSNGTGLGLSLVQKIIKMHKGQIELESTLGNGTTFRLLFPEIKEASISAGVNWRLKDECRSDFSYR